MNKLLYISFWLTCIFSIAFAQPYGNEWVDYDKTYYKFTVNSDKVYRIPYSTLIQHFDAADLNGTDFQLFGKGNEIPVYVSTDGQFTTTDYIEFYGEKNDGELDIPLYKNDEYLSTHYSIYNDNAAYFLTLNINGNSKRLTTKTNSPSGLPLEPFFWHTSLDCFIEQFNSGQQLSSSSGFNVLRDSYYGKGEGWTGAQFIGPSTKNRTLSTPAVYRADNSLVPKFKHVHLTKSFDSQHDIDLSVGSSTFNYTSQGFEINKVSEDISLGDITTGNTTISFRENNAAPVADAFASIEYPRLFDFANQTTFRFDLANSAATLLRISNFNNQSTTPILYDLNNGERYEAISNGNQYDFGLLPVTQARDLLMVSQAAANIGTIATLDSVGFINYGLQANQGDYFIITHRNLTTSTSGDDYVAAYNDYRNSEEGGSYDSKLAFIQDIENQFGFGVRNHPMAIRNFINYSLDNFTTELQHVFLIGKGISYNEIRFNSTNFNNCLIVSMGVPDSDVFLTARSAENQIPQVPIGRLSAHTGDRVAQYLEKVVEYEAAQNDTSTQAQTVENKQWMKRALHLGGGKDFSEQTIFKSFLRNYEEIIEKPLYGGTVTSVFKTSSEPIEISTSEVVDSLLENGISLITFFGHSSTSTIDFDISPEEFNNEGKYNVFLSNGCFVGSIFGPSLNTYSDRFIFQDRIGSVAYIAPITLAVSTSLNNYSSRFYNRLSLTMYNQSLGSIMRDITEDLLSNSTFVYDELLSKQMILHGDPALKLNTHNSPDYVISKESINYNPSIVSASRDSFDVIIAIANIGKSIDAQYDVNVERIFPTGIVENYNKRITSAVFKDTVVITLPTDRVNGLGTNILRIKVDNGEEIVELNEFNNEVIDTLVIFADDIIPVVPYEFCITNSVPDKIYFSTASIGTVDKNYILQIDTTEYFNSSLFQEQQVQSQGGIIEWAPNIPYIENTVYYVRSTLDSLINGDYNWNYSSYLYNTDLSGGWNQSHFFQFKKDDFFTLELDEPDRQFRFPDEIRELRLKNGVIQGSYPQSKIELFLDGNLLERGVLSKASMNFFVFDPNTGKYLESYSVVDPPPEFPTVQPCKLGTYFDVHPCGWAVRATINYIARNGFWRRRMIDFMENFIPDGAIVLVYTSQEVGATLRENTWEADVDVDYPKSLFSVFEDELGATKIREIKDYQPYLLFTQKGNPSFPKIEFNANPFEIIDTVLYFNGVWNAGALRSTVIGPSTKWDNFEMKWNSLETPSYDDTKVNISGIDESGELNTLYFGVADTVFSLENINAETYPHLQLELLARDDSTRTAPQLEHWRVTYDKVPEAAVNPALSYSISSDSIDIGQSTTISAGITNISDLNMDSLLVKVTLNREGGSSSNLVKRFGPLEAGQSNILEFDLTNAVITSPGNYTILLEANPNNDQPEQFHFNNYATFLLNVADDRINPLLDVTFDGIHILDGDIVSPKPEIIIKLKDENKGLALDDTSSIELYLYSPDQPNTPVFIDPSSENVTFVPADENELDQKNEAYIYYYPEFEVNGLYRLKVQGKDARDNDAGDYDYIVGFEVIKESSISNFLNYPNPFSNSTKFVFTLTGAEIPDHIKIQILTVSGKVVREITADELGPLKIGRNITEYTWDGTDRFGDKLANGLYIYKVFTKLNGETINQYKTNADKFFENDGYGKLYIVR